MPQFLAQFYPDLKDPRMESSVVVFHQRFSTNTLPQWRLAHPYRYLAHNGEINTVQGNRSWAVARGPLFHSPLLPDLADILPLVSLTEGTSVSSIAIRLTAAVSTGSRDGDVIALAARHEIIDGAPSPVNPDRVAAE